MYPYDEAQAADSALIYEAKSDSILQFIPLLVCIVLLLGWGAGCLVLGVACCTEKQSN